MKTHDARATSYQRLIEWADLDLGDALIPESKVPQGRASSIMLNADRQTTIDFEAIWKPTTPAHELISPAIDALTNTSSLRVDIERNVGVDKCTDIERETPERVDRVPGKSHPVDASERKFR